MNRLHILFTHLFLFLFQYLSIFILISICACNSISNSISISISFLYFNSSFHLHFRFKFILGNLFCHDSELFLEIHLSISIIRDLSIFFFSLGGVGANIDA